MTSAQHAANLIERLGRLARTGEQIGDLYPAQWAALRYLNRANRFSRTPMAITTYLATTRGTTSQTLIALEKKGYVTRKPSASDRRSVQVALTKAGQDKLAHDPLGRFAEELDNAPGTDVNVLAEQLESTLRYMIRANGGKTFGQCKTCRHFDENGGVTRREPHRCGLLDVGLSAPDTEMICVEHEPGQG